MPRPPGPLVIGMTAIGSVARRRVLTRAGARPGDVVYVSGRIGGAAAGLASLRGGPRRAAHETDDCRLRYRRPEPRVRLGVALGRNRAAHACIDLSDGLADAVRQLAAASGTGARIEADALPIHPEARAWLDADGLDPVATALQSGEDYELAFTAPADVPRPACGTCGGWSATCRSRRSASSPASARSGSTGTGGRSRCRAASNTSAPDPAAGHRAV